MSDPVQPPSRIGAARVVAATSGIQATGVDPSPSMLQLAAGTIVRGQVAGLDHAGNVLVRTDRGMLSLATHAHLPKGAEVVLQIRAAGSELHVLVMQVSGAPSREPGQPPPADRPPAAAPRSLVSQPDLLALGQPVRAIVHAAPTASYLAASSLAAGPAGPVANHDAVPTQVPDSRLPALAVGEELLVRLLDIRPTGTAPERTMGAGTGAGEEAAAGARVPPITGTVTAATGAGRPIVETSIGALLLKVDAALPPGTTLALQIQRLASSQVQESNLANVPGTATRLAHEWPALQEMLALLPRLGQTAAAAATSPKVIPQPGPHLASSILFLLSALRLGDLRGWLGTDILDALEDAGRSTLVTRLAKDFALLARLASDPGSGDWRVFIIPVLEGTSPLSLRLFLRRTQHNAEQERHADGPDEAQRFVVEVELSQLGELQLDGLVRDKRFDLILRSREPLPDAMREDLAEIFAVASSATGRTGQLGFSASRDWHPMPVETMDPASRGLLV